MVSVPFTSPARPLVAGLCVVLAALTAGCGATHAARPPAGAHRARATRSVTTGQSSTTTSTTTGGLPGDGKPAVMIGDKNFTEQFVLGQLYLQALQAQGFTVEINQNIGPPAVFTQALKSGTLAMYPDYLDTFDATIAGDRRRFASEGDAYQAAQRWAGRHGLTLLAPTPFSDTDAVAVTDAYAAEHHLRSLSDLRRVGATLVIGGAAQLATASPGLPVLSRVYGVAPAAFTALPVGEQYADLDDRMVQAAYVNTTDGQLTTGDYRLLGDPLRIFGWGNVVPVVSAAALAKEGPAFAATIERVDRALTLGVMRQLNSAVDVAKQNPAVVARQFLETRGLLGPRPSPGG